MKKGVIRAKAKDLIRIMGTDYDKGSALDFKENKNFFPMMGFLLLLTAICFGVIGLREWGNKSYVKHKESQIAAAKEKGYAFYINNAKTPEENIDFDNVIADSSYNITVDEESSSVYISRTEVKYHYVPFYYG